MPLTITYYAGISSPWTYLGHERICQLAKKYNAILHFKPIEFGTVFGKTGGLPLAKRAPERQNYRFVELDRWRKELAIDLNPRPEYFPVAPDRAALMCILVEQEGHNELALAGAFMRAVWAEDRNVADDNTLVEITNQAGFDGKRLLNASDSPELRSLYESYTNEAVEQGVFGAPSYVIGEEIFWGQDRLMFVEKKLKQESEK
ncbi:MAG: 2-hydroxychromene-2-carboxylate isomerase [Sneathiella sp.]|nr:2-hydroxychromene-2-carboxylate isomerase [Sneathiella sp.]